MSTKARRDSSLHWLQTIGALGGDFVIGQQVPSRSGNTPESHNFMPGNGLIFFLGNGPKPPNKPA